MAKQLNEALEELQDLSVKELIAFFKGPRAARESKVAKEGAQIAVKALGNVGRIKATDRARDATQVDVLRNMAKDREEFGRYVAASLPHLNPVKMLK